MLRPQIRVMLAAMTKTTPVIDDGDGQIVLIPAELAFSGEAVRIRREGDSVILEALDKDEAPERTMDANDRHILGLGLLVIAGAVWVRFAIGNESWTNWMMGGTGALLVGSRLIHWWRKRAR